MHRNFPSRCSLNDESRHRTRVTLGPFFLQPIQEMQRQVQQEHEAGDEEQFERDRVAAVNTRSGGKDGRRFHAAIVPRPYEPTMKPA